MTSEPMPADKSQGDLVVFSAIHGTGPAVLWESVPVVRGRGFKVSPSTSSKSAGTSLTLLTLTYKREWDAFHCFCKMDHHLNGLTNTNVFSYSPVHQKPKGYG